jgi:hypothetical protein
MGRGRIELPSAAGLSREFDETDERRPLGPQVDLGAFARIAVAGLAAVSFLILFNVLVAGVSGEELNAVARSAESFGWGLLLGAFSPAVWTAAGKLVDARVGTLTAKNDELLKALNTIKQTVEQQQGRSAAAGPQVPVPEVNGQLPFVLPALFGFGSEDAASVASEHLVPVLNEAADAAPGTFDVPAAAADFSMTMRNELLARATAAANANQPESAATINQVLGIVNSHI